MWPLLLPWVYTFSFEVALGDDFTFNTMFQIGVGICKEVQTSIYIAE